MSSAGNEPDVTSIDESVELEGQSSELRPTGKALRILQEQYGFARFRLRFNTWTSSACLSGSYWKPECMSHESLRAMRLGGVMLKALKQVGGFSVSARQASDALKAFSESIQAVTPLTGAIVRSMAEQASSRPENHPTPEGSDEGGT